MTDAVAAPSPGSVFALLVGIDEYLPPVPALFGCKNDIGHLRDYLMNRVRDRLRPVMLLDKAATRQAVIDGFRSHLTQAGKGDVALFAYSGHGSEEPAPEELAGRDATGRLQSLVCADSCRRIGGELVRPIADKELAVLISEVAAHGAHVVVILDCCHSGNGTRDAEVRVRQWIPDPSRARDAERADLVALSTARPVDAFLPGTLTIERMSDHIALFACQPFQLAKETTVGWEPRGAFSVALLDALKVVGPSTTYRSLLAAARARVERSTTEQDPSLFPTDAGGPADTLVLDGAVQTGPIAFHLTKDAGGWEIDAGAIHGLRDPADGEAFELTCALDGATTAAGIVRVTHVEPARSLVEPIGWTPEDVPYEAVITTVPLPLAVVRCDPASSAAATTAYERLGAALAASGPGGGPSPYVCLASKPGAPADALVLRVAAHEGGYEVKAEDGSVTRIEGDALRVLRADGTPACGDVGGLGEAEVRNVVARLEHVARWEQVRALGQHASALRDAVRLELRAVEPGEEEVQPGMTWPTCDPSTGFELPYRQDGGAWVTPAMFMRVVNTSDKDLFVAVLDLTDRYRCNVRLFPTARISAGVTVEVRDGAPILSALPEGVAVVPGATSRDWLKLLVSETNFEATAFEMPALDSPINTTRSASQARSTLERIAVRAITRDIGDEPVSADVRPDWCATTYPVTIRVP